MLEAQSAAERSEHETRIYASAIGFAEAQSHFPAYDDYGFGTDGYLDRVRCAKAFVAMPVIASLIRSRRVSV